MAEWYTCQRCPPHGMADHSMYGDKKCLCKTEAGECPCQGYLADETKPIKKAKFKGTIENPLPQYPR